MAHLGYDASKDKFLVHINGSQKVKPTLPNVKPGHIMSSAWIKHNLMSSSQSEQLHGTDTLPCKEMTIKIQDQLYTTLTLPYKKTATEKIPESKQQPHL